MPAIRGVGGGLIYFVDDIGETARIWEAEFEPLPEVGSPSETGLIAIDHVAQTMKAEEMLSWLLFYTAIVKASKSPMIDIVDPAGLVRSQVVENEEGSLRLTMNGAENRNTFAGHFIAESFGPGIQHLAFATRDIFATATALKQTTFRPLTISRNYYDDIEARFGLDPDFTDRLRSENILYDRDDKGEFFQLYGPTFGEGFFFEIVERRSGYRGYGAGNAPFRIAAQKRSIRPAGMPLIG
jgi:4-hydroxyphenylpyruvate dioxygenase